jgi:hypothetical protein
MTMKRILLLICFLVLIFLTLAAGASEKEQFKDKQIEELSKKFFRYSTVDGKESLRLTSEPSKEWYENAYNGLCKDTIVRLTSESLAISIPNSTLILAFLQCPPDPCDRRSDSIAALFDRKNLNSPLCFSKLDIDAGCYESLESAEVRKAGKGTYYVALTKGGGEGGQSWMTILLLHLDMACKITVLAKFDAGYGSYNDENDPGTIIGYRFIDDETVEVTTDHIVTVVTGDRLDEKVVKTTRERYDLDKLYNDPKSRVFPSKAEKALALVKSGFDVNTRDENGKTFLMIAAEDGSSEVVEALLDKGADVNAKTKDGYTVLMSAANGGDDMVVTLLLKRGADANAKDNNGWTALMTAAKTGRSKALKALLDRGADVNAQTKGGRTALNLAQREGHTKIVELLKERGAKE